MVALALASAIGGSILNNMAQQGANSDRQNIVNHALAAQQGYRGDSINAATSAMGNLGNLPQHVASRTNVVSNTIGDTNIPQSFIGRTGGAYQKAKGEMALSNARRKGELAKALGGMQGIQSLQADTGIQRSGLSSELGGINRQANQALSQAQRDVSAVRPNAGLQFLGEALNLGGALGGIL